MFSVPNVQVVFLDKQFTLYLHTVAITATDDPLTLTTKAIIDQTTLPLLPELTTEGFIFFETTEGMPRSGLHPFELAKNKKLRMIYLFNFTLFFLASAIRVYLGEIT